MCFRYYIRHFDFRLSTVGIQPRVAKNTTFPLKKCIYISPHPVSPLDDRLDYIRFLNVILLRLNGPRNMPKRIRKFGRAMELLQKS